MTDPIDYRDLLVRYMAHVGDREGTSCIPDANDGTTYFGRTCVPFSESEVAELERIEAEGDATTARIGAPRPRIVIRNTVPPEESKPPTPDQIWDNVDPLAGLKR